MKTDLKKELGTYDARRGRFDILTVPPLRYLMIDGHGDPNTAERYRDAVQTIYPVAYAVKFLSKLTLDRDYTVMPLEALWWADDMDAFTTARDKSQWNWTVLNLVPEWITDDHVSESREAVQRKGAAPLLEALRVDTLDEGLCVQTLHVGSFDDEAPVLDALHHTFIPQSGLRMTGRHHEIYLSDARRTAPEKLRTILRQPVERVAAAG
ncbi:GyrI-like domain-containing protein [Leifsonia sp. RAF41]|uniref:GyrI-like domain-containing protein n=1 Tax=Leifsonia sp. RAF41 TaxID=3233056 RepID=UPI003F9665AD